MAEFIEKEVAVMAILGQPPDAHYPSWYAVDIMQIPAADVRPVVRSHWEISCDGWYPYCPACGAEPPGRAMTPFCPMCSANMKGEK